MCSNIRFIKKSKGLKGEIHILGDKSISHRAVMLSSLGEDEVLIKNFLPSADCLSTCNAMKDLGATISFLDDCTLKVKGCGLKGLKEPKKVIDCGNSGTTLRLLMGILSGQNFYTAFSGDESLSSRPMTRVTDPLRKMGAEIFGRENSKFLPISINPKKNTLLKSIEYEMPVASAQVKSAILLAGLFSDGETVVIEKEKSRNHTEIMLKAFGVDIEVWDKKISIKKCEKLNTPKEINVPGDISSAAFWIVAASIIPNSEILIKNVGLNPSRTGIIDVILQMGGNIEILNYNDDVEPYGDILVKSAKLSGITIGGEIIPRIIDEIPIITVAALFAKGETLIKNAAELKVKETDRLLAIYNEFSKLTKGITLLEDGLLISGYREDNVDLYPDVCNSMHDHRIAMSLAILGSALEGVKIENADCVNISYPSFYETLDKISKV